MSQQIAVLKNGTVAGVQLLVTGSAPGHVNGTSPGNQRIEACWSFLCRYRSQWWIDLFKNLTEFGAFHPSCVTKTECLHFCFMEAIQKDTYHTKTWTNNKPNSSKDWFTCPSGFLNKRLGLYQGYLHVTACAWWKFFFRFFPNS